MWWLGRAEAAARKAGEGYGGEAATAPVIDEMVREQAAPAGDFDPAELPHGKPAASGPSFALAVLPLVVVIVYEFPDVAYRVPAARFFVPGKRPMGRHHDRGCVRCLVGDSGSCGGEPDCHSRQFSPFAIRSAKVSTPVRILLPCRC